MNRPCLALLLSLLTLAATAQQPAILNGVGIDQNLGAQVPLDLPLRDETGRIVHLADYVHTRPVLLNFVYYKCPGLCTQALNDVSRSLNGLTESAGDRFDVVTLSFDPTEGPDLATDKKFTYLRGYRRPTASAGWHFLTGPKSSIDAITQAVGFHYQWDAANKLYAHAAAIIVLTPQGKISRYFYGVEAPPTDLHQAILDASASSIGKPAEVTLLYCFKYDPTTGKWGLIISRMLQVLAVVTAFAIGSLLWVQISRERKKSVFLLPVK